MCYLCSWVPAFTHFRLYGQPFSSYRPFWSTSIEWPRNDLAGVAEHYKVKGTHKVLPVSPSPKFQPVSLDLRPAVFWVRPFETSPAMSSKWPWTLQDQRYPTSVLLVSLSVPKSHFTTRHFLGTRLSKIMNALEHLTVKITCIHKILTLPPKPLPMAGPNLGLFRSMTRHFQDITQFIISHWVWYQTAKKPKNSNLIFHKSFNNFGSDPDY